MSTSSPDVCTGVGRRPGHRTLSTGLQPRLKPLLRTKASGTPDDSANLSTAQCVQQPSPDCVHFSVTRGCPHRDPDSRGPCRSVTLAVGAWGPWQECVKVGSEGGWQLSGRSRLLSWWPFRLLPPGSHRVPRARGQLEEGLRGQTAMNFPCEMTRQGEITVMCPWGVAMLRPEGRGGPPPHQVPNKGKSGC